MAVLIILGGCSVQKHLPSTNTKIVYKDSVVLHTEYVSVPIPIENEKIITNTQKSHLETSVAISDAEIDSTGYLHHTLNNKKDSIKTKIQYVDKIQLRDSIQIKEVPVEVEKEVKYIPKIYHYAFFICIIELVILLVVLVFKLKSKFF